MLAQPHNTLQNALRQRLQELVAAQTASSTITTTTTANNSTSATTTAPVTVVATTVTTTTSTTPTAVQPVNRLPTADEIPIQNQQKLRERMLAIRAGFDKQLSALSLNSPPTSNEQNMSLTKLAVPALVRLASTPSAEGDEDVIPPKMVRARRSVTLNTAEPVSSIKCSICLEPCCTRAKNICPQKCESANMCLKCARQYWHSEIMSRRFFIAPLHCPGCQLPVPVKDWRKIAGEDMLATFRQYMSSIFYIRCSGCEQDACFLQFSGDHNNNLTKEARLTILQNKLTDQTRRTRAAIDSSYKSVKSDAGYFAREFTSQLVKQLGEANARRIILRLVPNIDFDSLVCQVLVEGNDAAEDVKKVQEQNEQIKDAFKAYNSDLTMEEEVKFGRETILAALDSLNSYAPDSSKRFCQTVTDVFGKKAARKLLICKAIRHDDENDGEEPDPDGELLLLIEDEERRAQVQHVFMKQFERKVATECCYTPVCFNCKFYDWHDDLSCEQIIKQTIEDMPVYVEEVVFQCPSCFVQIVHAGGCSSVRCVCGHDFCLEELGYTSPSTWDWGTQVATTPATPAVTPADAQQQPAIAAAATNTTPITTPVDAQEPTVAAVTNTITPIPAATTTATTTAATAGVMQAPVITTESAATAIWTDQIDTDAVNINWDE